jgi:hypothetical protein
MPENQSVPTSPEIPASPSLSPINDNGGQANRTAQNSLFEKISEKAGRLFEKHGVTFKRGRGRPRKDGLPKATDVPLDAGSASPAPAAPLVDAPVAAPGFDSNLVIRCVKAVVKALKGFGDSKLFNKAMQATGDAKFSRDLVAETTVTEEEISALAELSEICLKKYGVGTEYCPEIGVAAILAGGVIRYTVALKSIEAKIAEKQARGAN